MARVAPGDVVAALVAKGVPEHVAVGVTMNFMDESGLDTGIQEINPTAGRGGYGLAQWTGPRRVALEEFARSQGKPINDLATQVDFFMQENAGPEAAAWKAVMRAPTAQEAAVAFVNQWERPATKYAQQRSAKYSGSDPSKVLASYSSSPRHPPNPTVGTGGVTSPTANTTPVAAKEDGKTKWQKALSKGIGDISSAFSSAPLELRPVGMSTPQPIQPLPAAPSVAPSPADEIRRNLLAQLMQQYTMVG